MNKTGSIIRTIFFIVLGSSIASLAVIAAVVWHFSRDLPDIVTAADYRPFGVTQIVAVDPSDTSSAPEVIGEFYKERRYLIPYDKIPELVIQAFISAEDDQFFAHSGINFASILRASIANFKAGQVVQGGSTITQQVAKSLVLTSERSFVRKIKEIIVAARIEKNLTKQQILYLYLNQIYLGHGAYGVQAAAKTYFRKDVSGLSLAEAALIAGLPQAPGKFSPFQNSRKAKERQIYVLRRMAENHFISRQQMTEAVAQPIPIHYDEDLNRKHAAYYVEHLRRYLMEKYGDKAVYENALTVRVPFRPELARVAKLSLQEGLEAVDKRLGYRGPLRKLQGPAEIEDARNEERLKLIQGRIQYQMLMPDGRLDLIEALQHAGFKSERDLLETGKAYRGIVLEVNDKEQFALVGIGAAEAMLPMEHLRWARPFREERTQLPPEPTVPSQVVAKGDVILVKVRESLPGKDVVVSLEQVPLVQGALFSVDVATGNVLAMEGGYDFATSEFNRAIQAQRQPGSAFKPVIFSAALEKGYTPSSIIVDSPIVYEDTESGKWKPTNFEEKFYGDTTFRQALIKSRNVPTIKIVQSLQVGRLISYANRIGLNGQFNQDLSISLGSGATSLFELTKAFSIYPRLGRKLTPVFISSVTDRDGMVLEEWAESANEMRLAFAPERVLEQAEGEDMTPAPAKLSRVPLNISDYPLEDDPDQVLDPRVAYVMTHLLKEVVNSGTGQAARSLGRAAAGKTGTTNDYQDAWFMGYTPHIVSGVWVGYDNLRSVGQTETGARAALPIWLRFMKEAVKFYPDQDFPVPPGVVFATINPVNGKLVPPNSPNSIKEAFIEGTEPSEVRPTGRGLRDTGNDFFKEDRE